MDKNIPIPHNPRVPAQYSIPVGSYGMKYAEFYDQVLELARFYTTIGHEIVLIEFGIDRNGLNGQFYGRVYMNNVEQIDSSVDTIMSTLGNIIETDEILLFKQENHE